MWKNEKLSLRGINHKGERKKGRKLKKQGKRPKIASFLGYIKLEEKFILKVGGGVIEMHNIYPCRKVS